MDAVDRSILQTLMHDGRATWADLAVELGLTAPAIAQRVRRMHDRGLIRGFAALAAPERLAPVTAFVRLSLTAPETDVPSLVSQTPHIQECHRVAGDYEYVLKLRCGSLQHLAELTRALGVNARLSTSVVLETHKESVALPIPDDGEDA